MQDKHTVITTIFNNGTRLAQKNSLCHFLCQVTYKGTKIYKNMYEEENYTIQLYQHFAGIHINLQNKK